MLVGNDLETSEFQSFTSFCINHKERLSVSKIQKIICLRKLLRPFSYRDKKTNHHHFLHGVFNP